MITNEQQYRITKEWFDKFTEAAAQTEEKSAHLHPVLRKAVREGYESQADDLRDQLAEYEALRDNHIAVLELDSLAELPEALIHARKAAGLTQRELAGRLGLKEQQIQRYEATRYAGANLTRIQAVVEALGVQIHERLVMPTAAGRVETARRYSTHSTPQTPDETSLSASRG